MKKILLLGKISSLIILCLVVSFSYSQNQTIGSFPTMQGGFENVTAASQTATTISTGTQLTAWTGANTTNSTQSIGTSTVRSGSKCLDWSTASTSGVLFTPTASTTSIANATQYVVQFYWWKNNTGSARALNISIGSDGTTSIGTAVSSGTLGTNSVASSGWTKATVVVTTGTSANNPRYGLVRQVPNGGSFASYLIDDYVVYAGSSADVTAPADPSAPGTGTATSNSLTVSWTAPGGGVDGGGYLVVRGTVDPSTTPNVNGIYGVGNSIGSGTVAYIGTSTSFIDNGLSPSTQYFYRIYTVDKAFNYSAAITTNGTTSSPDPEPTNHVTAFSAVAGSPSSTAITVNWTDATGGQLPSGYLIKASTTSFAAITDPSDATAEADATLVKNITSGVQTASFTGLTANTTYYFKIYPYTNAGAAIDYKTDGSVPTTSLATSYISNASDQFRSNAANGVWATAGDWESSPNGTDWYTATLAPTTTSASITIRNGHTISVNATASADDMTIDAGGKVIVNNIAFTVANGAAATDLTVNGTLELTGAAGAVTPTGAISFVSGSLYTHNANGRTIPTATWNSNSTVEITGVTATQPSGLGQTFGNFTWNSVNQSQNIGLGNPASFVVAGTFTVTSTGGVTNRAVRFTAGNAYTLTVGHLNLNGGHLGLSSGAGTMALTVLGDVNISNGSELYLSQSGSVNGTLNVGGDFTAATGTTVTETGSSTGHTIVFNKSGAQALTANSATFSNDLNYTVNNGSTVNLSGTLTVNTGRTLTLNGNFAIGSGSLVLNGLTIAGTATNLSSTSSSSFTIGGATAGHSVPSSITDLSNLTIGNTSGVTLNGNISIADLLTINASGILDAGTNSLTGAGSGTWNINGTLKTADLDGFAGASKTIPSATIALGSSSTIEYTATSGTQTVDGRTDYANLTLSGAANKTIGSGVEIGGNFTVSGGTATPPATVTFDGTTGTQSIAGLAYETVAFNGTGNKTFNTDGSVSTAVTFAPGQAATIDFDGAANDKVFTVKSTAAYTARIENKESYTLSGKIKAERYYPSRRAWRLMAAPVSATGSINSLWQNGNTNTAGIGTLITGPGADPGTNGLDVSPQNTTTLYTYNQAGASWTAVTNTLTTNVSDNAAYLIFIRGDRNTNNLTIPNSNTTTLHSTGTIKSGDQNLTTDATADGYALFGNPYPSPIDFDAAYVDADNAGALGTGNNTNLQRRFYVWDPTLGDRGAYVTLSDDNNDGSYDKSNGSSAQTQHIQSGQGFFVQTRASGLGTAQFTIKESHKSATNNNSVFRPGLQREKLSVILKRVNTDGSLLTTDGGLVLFENTLSTALDAADADKFTNMDESVSFRQGNKLLSIQGLPLADINDTIFINVAGMKQRDYVFAIDPSSFNAPGLTAYLEDAFLGSSTPLSLSTATNVSFSVTSNTATSAANRFRIVFKSNNPLPVSFMNVKAYEKNTAIQVEWTIASEAGVNRYEVEESADAISFIKTKAVQAKANNNTTMTYSWLDNNIVSGANYYRIRSVSDNGEIKLSPIVKVNIGKGQQGFGVYPNPVSGGAFNLQMNNMESGTYTLDLFNASGQKTMSRTFQHTGGSATQGLVMDQQLKPGVYQLVVQNKQAIRLVQTIIIKD